MILNSIIVAILMTSNTRWYPRFQFSKSCFNEQSNFGWNNLGFSIMHYFSGNLDYLIVSKTLGTYFLGIYEFAYRVPYIIHQRLVQPVGLVIYPAMSKVKTDREAVFELYSDTIYLLSFIVFPLLGGMIVVANEMVSVIWGDKWLEVVLPLQILAFCTILRVWPQSIGAVFLIDNRPDIPFKISIFVLVFSLVFVSSFAYFWGIIGVAWGMVFSLIPSYYAVYLSLKRLNKTFLHIFHRLYPIIIITLLMMSIVYLFKSFILIDFLLIINLIFSVFIGIFTFIFLFVMIFKKDVLYVLRVLYEKSNNRFFEKLIFRLS